MNERNRELALQVDLMRYPSDGINIRIERFAELVRADEREACERAVNAMTKREWVGLTYEEVHEVLDNTLDDASLLDVCRAIEAKLKEKNNEA